MISMCSLHQLKLGFFQRRFQGAGRIHSSESLRVVSFPVYPFSLYFERFPHCPNLLVIDVLRKHLLYFPGFGQGTETHSDLSLLYSTLTMLTIFRTVKNLPVVHWNAQHESVSSMKSKYSLAGFFPFLLRIFFYLRISRQKDNFHQQIIFFCTFPWASFSHCATHALADRTLFLSCWMDPGAQARATLDQCYVIEIE